MAKATTIEILKAWIDRVGGTSTDKASDKLRDALDKLGDGDVAKDWWNSTYPNDQTKRMRDAAKSLNEWRTLCGLPALPEGGKGSGGTRGRTATLTDSHCVGILDALDAADLDAAVVRDWFADVSTKRGIPLSVLSAGLVKVADDPESIRGLVKQQKREERQRLLALLAELGEDDDDDDEPAASSKAGRGKATTTKGGKR